MVFLYILYNRIYFKHGFNDKASTLLVVLVLKGHKNFCKIDFYQRIYLYRKLWDFNVEFTFVIFYWVSFKFVCWFGLLTCKNKKKILLGRLLRRAAKLLAQLSATSLTCSMRSVKEAGLILADPHHPLQELPPSMQNQQTRTPSLPQLGF